MTGGNMGTSFEALIRDISTALAAHTDASSHVCERTHEEDGRLVAALGAVVRAVADSGGKLTDSPATGEPEDVRQQRASSLAALLGNLRHCSRDLIMAEFRLAKRAALYKYLQVPEPSVLEVLNKSTDENSHSDVLRWLLDPSVAPRVAGPALLSLFGLLRDGAAWQSRVRAALDFGCISVRREVVLGGEGGAADDRDRLDLLITGPDFLVAVENKITALEHDGQTRAYWRWLQGRTPLKVAGVFLTPFGDRPDCPEFVSVSYTKLLSCLLDGPITKPISRAEEYVLAGYVKTLAIHVLGPEIRWFCEQLTGGKK